jgi:hypothetical protein
MYIYYLYALSFEGRVAYDGKENQQKIKIHMQYILYLSSLIKNYIITAKKLNKSVKRLIFYTYILQNIINIIDLLLNFVVTKMKLTLKKYLSMSQL